MNWPLFARYWLALWTGWVSADGFTVSGMALGLFFAFVVARDAWRGRFVLEPPSGGGT